MNTSREHDLSQVRIAFFGSSSFSLHVLETMEARGIVPCTIITTPDTPKGRGRILQPNDVKVYAETRGIPCFTPSTLKDEEVHTLLTNLKAHVFLVASYGKIIPQSVLDIPSKGTLNIHPSLLPKYRGPSPIQSMIREAEPHVGVTIMLLDALVDHGPLLASREVSFPQFPIKEVDCEAALAREGAHLFLDVLPAWISGNATPQAQDHAKATFTRKFSKEDGRLDFTIPTHDIAHDIVGNSAFEHSQKLYQQFCAFHRSPGAFFFDMHNGHEIRIKVTEAAIIDGRFTPLRIIPEGRKEIPFDAYIRGRKEPHISS